MLSPRLDWLRGCCACNDSAPGCGTPGELQVHLSSDHLRTRHPLTKEDSFDLTFGQRSGTVMTPRQKTLQAALELPMLATYPQAPSVSVGDSDEAKKQKLLAMYQEFALDLHAGMYLTQLTSSRDYSDIHCQLMEDLTTLKLDQNNGQIIEFPLKNVSKVYRIVKNDDSRRLAAGRAPSCTEQIVVVEFMRRKLAFVFQQLHVSQRFLICMELLIRRAQQKQETKVLRSLTPAFPPQVRTPARTAAASAAYGSAAAGIAAPAFSDRPG